MELNTLTRGLCLRRFIVNLVCFLSQSNAKLKLVRSLAVCEESSCPFSTDGPPESQVTCLSVSHTRWFYCSTVIPIESLGIIRTLFSFTSAVRLIKRKRSRQKTSTRTKRGRRRIKPHARCFPAVNTLAFYLVFWFGTTFHQTDLLSDK